MNKTKLTLIALILLLGATQVMANRKLDRNCCQPMPVGGLETLSRNTVYPAFALTVKNDADVILNFHVDKNGNVSDIQVAKSGGDMFDESAIKAVINTQWTPAMQNGHPVALTFALPFEYRSK